MRPTLAAAALLLLLPVAATAQPAGGTRPAPPVTPTAAPKAAPGAADKASAPTKAEKPAPAPHAKPRAATAEQLSKPLHELYEEALNAFKYQDFDTAIPLLRKLLAKGKQLDRKRRWRVREFLGAALWFAGDKQGAADQFTGLLIKNPQASLDPAYYPPRMIADFVKVRRKMIALGMIKEKDKPPPTTSMAPATETNPILLWMPFGVGQLANDETGKGLAFLIAESALLSTNLYYRFYVNEPDAGPPKYALDPTNQAIQIVTGAAFYLVSGWGIADALLTRRQATLPRVGTLPTAR